MTPFAEWMTKQMERRRLNQSQVATYIGLRPSGVNAWFTRDTIPTPATCAKLAELFHVTIDEVLAVAGHLVPQAPVEGAIDEQVRQALARMTPEEQREFALPAIELAEVFLRQAREKGE